jgi:hypothetical protein
MGLVPPSLRSRSFTSGANQSLAALYNVFAYVVCVVVVPFPVVRGATSEGAGAGRSIISSFLVPRPAGVWLNPRLVGTHTTYANTLYRGLGLWPTRSHGALVLSSASLCGA